MIYEKFLSKNMLLLYSSLLCFLNMVQGQWGAPGQIDPTTGLGYIWPEGWSSNVGWLVGKWTSEYDGKAVWPTMPATTYGEYLEFVPGPYSVEGVEVLKLTSSAWSHTTKDLLLGMYSYMTVDKNGATALLTTMNNGFSTLEIGTSKYGNVELNLSEIGRMNIARQIPVEDMKREFRLITNDYMEQIVTMRTTQHPTVGMLEHARILYKRVPDPPTTVAPKSTSAAPDASSTRSSRKIAADPALLLEFVGAARATDLDLKSEVDLSGTFEGGSGIGALESGIGALELELDGAPLESVILEPEDELPVDGATDSAASSQATTLADTTVSMQDSGIGALELELDGAPLESVISEPEDVLPVDGASATDGATNAQSTTFANATVSMRETDTFENSTDLSNKSIAILSEFTDLFTNSDSIEATSTTEFAEDNGNSTGGPVPDDSSMDVVVLDGKSNTTFETNLTVQNSELDAETTNVEIVKSNAEIDNVSFNGSSLGFEKIEEMSNATLNTSILVPISGSVRPVPNTADVDVIIDNESPSFNDSSNNSSKFEETYIEESKGILTGQEHLTKSLTTKKHGSSKSGANLGRSKNEKKSGSKMKMKKKQKSSILTHADWERIFKQENPLEE